jgi:hypothetical protein
MKHRKTKACIAAISAARRRGGLGPEQEQALEFAEQRLKRFSRLKKASSCDAYNCVAEISERLTKAFSKTKGVNSETRG